MNNNIKKVSLGFAALVGAAALSPTSAEAQGCSSGTCGTVPTAPPTSGCGSSGSCGGPVQTPPTNLPGQVIVSNNNSNPIRNDNLNDNDLTNTTNIGIDNNVTTNVRTDIASTNTNTLNATGGNVNLASGAVQGGQGGNGYGYGGDANATGGSVNSSGNSSSSSVAQGGQGGNVSGVQTGSQSVSINNPRNAFSPSVNAFASGDCGKGISVNVGLPGFGSGLGFSGQTKWCHDKRDAMGLVVLGTQTDNPELAATGFARLVEGDKKLGEAYENRSRYTGMFAQKAAEPVQTFVVPPQLAPAPNVTVNIQMPEAAQAQETEQPQGEPRRVRSTRTAAPRTPVAMAAPAMRAADRCKAAQDSVASLTDRLATARAEVAKICPALRP